MGMGMDVMVSGWGELKSAFNSANNKPAQRLEKGCMLGQRKGGVRSNVRGVSPSR